MPEEHLERRVVSVLFADIVGFTSLSEGLDAEDVSALQDQYFADVRDVVGRYGGRLEKFIGDAAMAVFGVPRSRDDDAERAVRAGLALVRSIEALPARISLDEGALRLRVGVNSGEVAYAPGGDGEWRVSGDAVNVAARLQTAAQPGTVLLGDTTALAVADAIVLDAPVNLDLKGKTGQVRAWRAVTPLPQRSRERAMGSLRAPLLGRQGELAQISAAVDRVRGGATETLIVVAPPGVGKTRLVDELAERAWQGGSGAALPVIRARLRPDTVSVAAAVTQLLAAALDRQQGPLSTGHPAELERERVRLLGDVLARSLPADRAEQLTAEMSRLLAETESLPGRAPAAANELDTQRELRFRAWIEALDALGGARPQLWLMEDLHWSGGDLLAFIEQASVQPAPRGRLVLGTARPGLLEQLAGRPAGGATLTVLELQPLPVESAHDLVAALVGDALPAPLSAAIVEAADGTPLFIEELLRSWVSLGLLVLDEEGRWRLTAEPDEVALPQTVQQIYAAQLDDLPDAARTLVRRASVAGRNVPRESLPTLGMDEPEPALETARRRALLVSGQPDLIYGAALIYRHALLRDAGYASLARAERARLHARLAGWYEQIAGPRVEEVAEQIAGHYAAALENASRLRAEIDDDLDSDTARTLALRWFERAAARALAGAAHESGRSLLRRALAYASQAEPTHRGRLLLRLGEATAYTADMDEGGRLVEEALELFRGAASGGVGGRQDGEARAGYAEAAAALGRVWIQQLRFAEAGQLAARTLAEIGGPDDAGVARLLSVRGWVQSTLTEDRSSLADVDRALAIARALADRPLELEMLDWRARVLGELDMVEMADIALVEKLAVELGDAARALRSKRARAGFLLDDHAADAWDIADEAAEMARRRGGEEDLAWIEYLRAEAGFVAGDWDRALAAGRHAVEIGEKNAYHRVVVRTWHVLLPIAEARADRLLTEHADRWYAARAGTFPDSPYARIMEGAANVHFMRAGLRPPAVLEVEPRLASFDGEPGGPSWVEALETVVENWLAAGELAGARAAVERLNRAAVEHPATSALGRGVALHLRARLLAVDGAGRAEVGTVARAALRHFRLSRATWWTAKSLRVLLESGDGGGIEADELAAISARLRLALSA